MFFKATTALCGPDDALRHPAGRHQSRLGGRARGRDRRGAACVTSTKRARSTTSPATRCTTTTPSARSSSSAAASGSRARAATRSRRSARSSPRRDEIADPQTLGMWLTVNGETRQQGHDRQHGLRRAHARQLRQPVHDPAAGRRDQHRHAGGRRARDEAGAGLPAAGRRRRARHRRARRLAPGSGGARVTRHVLAVDLKDDPAVIEAYSEHHRRVWPEVLRSLARGGLADLEIYRLGRRLVMIVEPPTASTPPRVRGPRRLAPARRRMGSADEILAAAGRPAPPRANGGRSCSRSSISMRRPCPT